MDMMKLYDKARPCEKCGQSGVSTRHMLLDRFTPTGVVFEEYMLRTCSNCGVQWRELPLDHKEPTNG